jgi:hypothetical protein
MTDDEQGAGAPKRPRRLPAAHDKFGRLRGKENGGRERGLQRIRDHHHRIAFLMARGKRALEISKQTGLSLDRVLRLRTNPEFCKLLEAYEAKLDKAEGRFDEIEFEEFRTEQKIRAANLSLALEIQQERLLEQPETFSHRDLQELISDTSDRLDMGKTQKHLHGHVDLAANLALARQRRLQLNASGNSQPDAEEAAPANRSGNGKLQ